LIFFIFLTLLILSAFFSGSETALLSLNKFQLKKMEKNNTASTDRILAILSHPRRFLLTILTGNTLVNIAATSYGTMFVMHHFGHEDIGLGAIVILFVLLIFGEILPKTYAYLYAEKFSSFVAYPVTFVILIFTPFRKVLSLITDSVVEWLGFIAPKDSPDITNDEIKSMIKIGEREGIVKETEKEMIYGVFEFRDQRAKDIMTPKIDVQALDFDMPEEDVVKYVKIAMHSRLPVYRDSLDNVTGIAYSKDILFNSNKRLKDIMREAYFVPESERIHNLLTELQKRSIQMAIVTDEYGITTGIVTIEDILEEIVGEIVDEYDKEIKLITKIDEKTYRVKGLLKIDDANKLLKLGIKTAEVDTMGGFVSLLMQKIPNENESIVYKKFKLTVTRVYKNRIEELIVKKI